MTALRGSPRGDRGRTARSGVVARTAVFDLLGSDQAEFDAAGEQRELRTAGAASGGELGTSAFDVLLDRACADRLAVALGEPEGDRDVVQALEPVLKRLPLTLGEPDGVQRLALAVSGRPGVQHPAGHRR